MTTKELIRQEIVRRIEWLNTATNDFAEGRRAELRSLYDFINALPDEPVEKTCRSCVFYENDCPFTRDKFMPYPNRVCKDYTFSTLKAEQEPESEDERIRKHLVDMVKRETGFTGFPSQGQVLAYLEKQKEQPEVDLEKAARHVYESWMGGTMDEFRRDMDELSKVLNARKEGHNKDG